VVHPRDHADVRFLYPSPELARESRVGAVPSPVPMPEIPGINTYWIGAPGHAWTRIAYEVEEAMTTVVLDPGAGLEIGVGALREDLALHILSLLDRTSGEELMRLRVKGSSTLLLEGLAPGPHLVRLARLAALGHLEPLVTEEVDLLAGRTARVTLDVEDQDLEFGGILLGRVELPDGLRAPPVEIELFRRTGDGTGRGPALHVPRHELETLGPSLRIFEIESLSPGDYELRLGPYGVTETATVLSGRTTSVTLRVPELARVKLRVTDASGALLAPRFLAWRAENDPYHLSFPVDPGSNPLRFEAAPGPVSLVCTADGHRTSETVHALEPGDQEITVRKHPEPHHDFVVRLLDGSSAVHVPHLFWSSVQATPVSGKGEIVSRRLPGGTGITHASSRATLVVNAAGRYLLSVPEVAGYELAAPIPFEISDGSPCVVDVQLLRP